MNEDDKKLAFMMFIMLMQSKDSELHDIGVDAARRVVKAFFEQLKREMDVANYVIEDFPRARITKVAFGNKLLELMQKFVVDFGKTHKEVLDDHEKWLATERAKKAGA